MKDKRQRIAITWPYAAVYADRTFAASLLQAAANSVNMPYYIPQMPVIAPQIPTANHYSYNYQYSPYQISHRNPAGVLAPSHSSPISTPPDGTPFTRADLMNGHNTSLCSEYLQSPASPLSPLSLSPISDSDKVNLYTKYNLHTFTCARVQSRPLLSIKVSNINEYMFIHFRFYRCRMFKIHNRP